MNERNLGLGSSIAVCVGLIVATSCLVSLGTGMGMVGRWFIIPLFAVMFLNAFIGISFAELHSLMPDVDGGTGQYLLAGMGPVAAIIGNVSVYYLTMVFSITAEITMCGMVLSSLFFPEVDYRVISMIILIVFFIVNLFSIDVFSAVQDVVVILLLGSMLILGIIGTFKLGTGEVVDYTATAPSFEDIGGLSGIMSMAAIAFWLFIGVEFVIPVSKYMKNPKRDVLLSMVLGLIILFLIQSILGTGMTNYVSLNILEDDPTGMPHMTFAANLLGQAGRFWMGGVTILAAISSINTVFAANSRIFQGMGNSGLLPKVFTKTNRNGVAIMALIVMAVSVGIIVISNFAASNGITFLILAASCFWLVTYCMVHISVLRLRKKYPEHPRSRLLTLAGIPQIIGIIGNIYMICYIDSGSTRLKIYAICGVLFILLSAFAFIWICFVKKVKPFKSVPIEYINKDISIEEILKYTKEQ